MYSYFFLSVKTFLQLDRLLPLSHHAMPLFAEFLHPFGNPSCLPCENSKTQTGEWRWSEYVVSASVVLRQT